MHCAFTRRLVLAVSGLMLLSGAGSAFARDELALYNPPPQELIDTGHEGKRTDRSWLLWQDSRFCTKSACVR